MLCHRADAYEQSHTDGLHGFVEAVRADGGGGGGQSPAVMNPTEGNKFTYMVLPVRLKAE